MMVPMVMGLLSPQGVAYTVVVVITSNAALLRRHHRRLRPYQQSCTQCTYNTVDDTCQCRGGGGGSDGTELTHVTECEDTGKDLSAD